MCNASGDVRFAPESDIKRSCWFLLWHPWSVTTYIRCGPFVTLKVTGSLQLREHLGCGRAKHADALEKSRHHAHDQFFGAVFHDLGRGAGKLGAGKDCRTTLRSELRELS